MRKQGDMENMNNKKRIRVLLVNPPTIEEIPESFRGISYYTWLRTKNKFYDFVPGELLGAQCIESYVQSHNHDCDFEILNACVEEHTTVEQTLQEIRNRMPLELVCFTGPYNVFHEVQYLASQVKEEYPGTYVMYGQFFASLCYEEILNKYKEFDFLNVGYGEITISKMIQFLQAECVLEDIPGLAYRDKEGNVVYNNEDGCCLDEIVDVKPTRNDIQKVIKSGLNVSIHCSRGCPYRCSFCATGTLMGKMGEHNNYRLRDPYEVVDEIEEIYNKYHINKITFVDDTFAANTVQGKEQAKIIAEEIIKRNIHLEIMIDTRIDCIDKELFTLLYQAGVHYVNIGIESANNQNLIEFNKGYKADRINESLQILEDIGIHAVYGFINFNPETTMEELKSNVELLKQLKYTDPTMYSHEFIPYPGIDMTNRLLKDGLITGEFPDYQNKYKHPEVYEVKMNYDRLLSKYTMFLFNMNKTPDFHVQEYQELNEKIYELFSKYFEELVQTSIDKKNIAELFNDYDAELKAYLKQILIGESNKKLNERQ